MLNIGIYCEAKNNKTGQVWVAIEVSCQYLKKPRKNHAWDVSIRDGAQYYFSYIIFDINPDVFFPTIFFTMHTLYMFYTNLFYCNNIPTFVNLLGG